MSLKDSQGCINLLLSIIDDLKSERCEVTHLEFTNRIKETKTSLNEYECKIDGVESISLRTIKKVWKNENN